MSLLPTQITYQELANALKKADSSFKPAEVHGFICGILAATGGKLDNTWIKTFTGAKKNRALNDCLQQLLETSYHEMSEFSFEFSLLLPEDEEPILIRSESLGAWCEGFLTGLNKYHVPLKNRSPSDTTESINDMIEISQINFDEVSEDDEDENAYFELVEYVRLAVLMIFQELNTQAKSRTGEADDD